MEGGEEGRKSRMGGGGGRQLGGRKERGKAVSSKFEQTSGDVQEQGGVPVLVAAMLEQALASTQGPCTGEGRKEGSHPVPAPMAKGEGKEGAEGGCEERKDGGPLPVPGPMAEGESPP
jgi:hypothetical protein